MRAVLERDYVAEAARSRGFAARTLLGAFATIWLLLSVLGKGTLAGEDYDRIGASVFSAVGIGLFVFLAVTTPLLLVGSIATERQRNTLEILLATPEGPVGVARGKFLARLGTALTWAAAALPPLTVAVLFGGTPWRALVNLGATLLGTTLELAGWGLLVSSVSRRLATAAVLVFALPAAHWGLEGALVGPNASPVWTLLGRASTPLPAFRLDAWDADIAVLRGSGLEDWLRIPGLWHLLAGALVAAIAVPLSARMLAAERVGRDLRLHIPRVKGEGRLRAFLTRGNPVAWKESLLLNTAWSRFLYYFVLALLVAGEVVVLYLKRHGDWNARDDAYYVAGSFTALAGMAAIQGAAAMSHEKSQGTFDLLRVTCLTPGEIARGKVVGVGVGISFLFLIPIAHLALGALGGVHDPVASLVAAGTAILVAANYAVHGLTWGILARTPGTALAGAAAFLAMSFGGCPTLCIIPFGLAAMRMLRRDASTDFFEVIVIPGALCGSPILLLPPILSALSPSASGSGSGSGAATFQLFSMGGYAAALLVVTLLYLFYRWYRLPEVLEREMARLTVDSEDGSAPYLPPAPARPDRDHLTEAVRKLRESRLRKEPPA